MWTKVESSIGMLFLPIFHLNFFRKIIAHLLRTIEREIHEFALRDPTPEL